jgi:hypothetical protein
MNINVYGAYYLTKELIPKLHRPPHWAYFQYLFGSEHFYAQIADLIPFLSSVLVSQHCGKKCETAQS